MNHTIFLMGEGSKDATVKVTANSKTLTITQGVMKDNCDHGYPIPLFKTRSTDVIDLGEYPEFRGVHDGIRWDMQMLLDLVAVLHDLEQGAAV